MAPDTAALNAHGRPMSESHGHGGCKDGGDLGPCDCLCHRDPPTTTAASIPYEGTDCTPDEAVEAVKRYRRALRKIADCPNPDSVENCHDQMWVIAQEALGE